MPCYIIQAGDTPNVKIGWADDDVEQRRLILQTGCWLPLRAIRIIDGPPATERWMHRRFGHLRGPVGEWFTFDPQMLTVSVDLVWPSAEVVEVELLSEIGTFLGHSGMSATAFGRDAAADPTLVHELRRGRECKRATRARIREFIRQQDEVASQSEAA